ncbi:MAG: asparagine synthase-related protein, partial [Candidatus Binataceae bacterium]
LKTAMENRLPPGIAHRKKQGFSIPMKNWIRGDLLEYTYDTVFSSGLVANYFNVSALRGFWQEHQQSRHNHSHLFWTLLNLSIWERLFLSGIQLTTPPRTLAQASC